MQKNEMEIWNKNSKFIYYHDEKKLIMNVLYNNWIYLKNLFPKMHMKIEFYIIPFNS